MSSESPETRPPAHSINEPDTKISAKEIFGLDRDMQIPAFSQNSEYVPRPRRPLCF